MRPVISSRSRLSTSAGLATTLLISIASAGLLTQAAHAGIIANPEHASITEYTGPETCIQCHRQQASDMFGSVHYQWTGPTPDVANTPGWAGKRQLAFNTYCGTVSSSRRFTCSGCHVGNGAAPSATLDADQLNNIDCLLCHQDAYVRKAAGPFETVMATDYQNNLRSWQMPIEDASGSFLYQPDTSRMTISLVEAAQTVHLPTRASCLRCHANAAGGDGNKRGDLSSASVNPAETSDIHMSPTRGGLDCQYCHITQNHRIMGRGLDLRPTDLGTNTCTDCHSASEHTDAQNTRHAVHIACQTCHIPTYGKDVSTETVRNWTTPTWGAELFGGQGGFKPSVTRGSNLTPTYAWYDGSSDLYELGQVPTLNTAGQYELGAPRGSVTSANAKIYPMKEHRSIAGRHAATGQMIPHSSFTYFTTGDFNRAIQDGMLYAGMTGTYSVVNVHTYQTINHGVVSKANALTCGACHAYYSGGQPVRMDLKGKLGYQQTAPNSTLCNGTCHHDESGNFENIHSRHVTSRHYDCLFCHSFSRPERAPTHLTGTDSDGDGFINTYDNCPNKANPSQSDLDHDGIGDDCDNCYLAYNPDQLDSNGNGVGNACENDMDYDTIATEVDNCPGVYNPYQQNLDGDGKGDDCDACPDTPFGLPVDGFGCTMPIHPDFDADGDVDMEDFAVLQVCLGETSANCQSADLNFDGSIDAKDTSALSTCLGGPSAPPANDWCAN